MLTNKAAKMHNVGEKELYRIINRTLSKIGEDGDEPVNKELVIFKQYYNHYIRQYPYPSLFEEPRVTMQDIAAAQEFCDVLEAYRLSTDVHAKENPEFSVLNCRILYNGLKRYKNHILPEHQMLCQSLEKTAKSILPEFREEYILNSYNEQAKLIYAIKKTSKSDCARLTVAFFDDVLNDEELKNTKPSLAKIELYENTLKIVNYLPANKYSRTSKLRLKSKLNYAIHKTILKLPTPDMEKAEKAYEEGNRYRAAAENISRYITQPDKLAELRRKRMQDEWRYK